MSADFLSTNLELLGLHDPVLAGKIRSVEPSKDAVVSASRTGAPSLKIGTTTIHSAFDPEREAREWAADVHSRLGSEEAVVILGFGLGYHIEALVKLIPDKQIIVFEPRIDLLKCAFEARDLTGIIPRIGISDNGIPEFSRYFTVFEFLPEVKIDREIFHPIVNELGPLRKVCLNPGDEIDIKVDELEDIAAILIYGRSGSAFFGSLLDNHPNVIMIPGTYIMGFFEFWDRFGKNAGGNEALISIFCDQYEVLFDPRAPLRLGIPSVDAGTALSFEKMGVDRDREVKVDRTIFVGHLSRILDSRPWISRKFFFQAIHAAYALAIGRKLSTDRPLIVFPIHSQILSRIIELDNDFPNAKYITVLREPVQTMNSITNYYSKNNFDFSSLTLLEFLFGTTLISGSPMIPRTAPNNIGVRLEDLHRRPRETMEAVARWLALPWSDTLMESTYAGLKWWNVADSIQISGFGEATITKRTYLGMNRFDKFRIRMLCSEKARRWGYPSSILASNLVVRFLSIIYIVIPFGFEHFFLVRHARHELKDTDKKSGLLPAFRIYLAGHIRFSKLYYFTWKRNIFGPRNEIPVLRPNEK